MTHTRFSRRVLATQSSLVKVAIIRVGRTAFTIAGINDNTDWQFVTCSGKIMSSPAGGTIESHQLWDVAPEVINTVTRVCESRVAQSSP